MKNAINLILAALCLISSIYINANNPLVKNVGMADPHIYIFNNKVYLFATRDSSAIAKEFIMPDWNIWTSENLIDWQLERTIKPTETYMGISTRCWATETAYRNGKYYFYFSNGNDDTGVMTSNSPTGPYVDALGKALLPKNLTTGKEYDPTILQDDDKLKSAYIVFGHFVADNVNLQYRIAKLNNDMISLAENPKDIQINGDINFLKGNDKPNLHKHNGLYYLSAGAHYATATNIYGPYTRRGTTGNGKYGLDGRAHGNFFEWNAQWFHTWCHFHLGKEVAYYRESYLSYLHFKDNGEMITDTGFLAAHFETGVGQYDATWEKIEAEWYMAASKVDKKECPRGGFEIQAIKNNGFLYYPNIKNLKNCKSVTFSVSSMNSGTLEIRSGNTKGKLLGTCKITTTGSWKKYRTESCKLTNFDSSDNVCIVFKGKSNDICHLDYFQFYSK